MTIYFPNSSKIQGTKKVAFCTSIANLAAPKIATEIKASSSVEATLAIRTFDPVFNTNTGNSPARLGTTQQLPQEGNTTLGAIQLQASFNPALPTTDANNKLQALLVQGALLYAVIRRGTDINTDWTATTDLADVWYGRIGFVNDDDKSGDDEFAEYQFTTNFYPLQPKTKAVLAA